MNKETAAPGAAVSRRIRRKARRLWRLCRKEPVQAAPEGLDAKGRALAAIEALPEPVRNAFILARFEDWPYSRIADHLGIAAPVGPANESRNYGWAEGVSKGARS